ncbi:MAG: SAM-dependent methyltransferase [bacterium]|nr:SAM-dependent methyltransferase [bacterium]
MTREDLHYFVTSEGQNLLREAREIPGDELTRLTRLRKRYAPQRCRAAVTLLALRERATAKYTYANEMALDREGLEQASGETIATYRARRYRKMSCIADLCCGIGGDTAALAKTADVIAVDNNPDRIAITRWNTKVQGATHRVWGVAADLSRWLPKAEAIFMDPGRRRNNRRILNPMDYLPPLELARLLEITPHIGVKVAPGIAYEHIPDGCEVEFISESGACKEAVLWFGDLQTSVARRATILPSEQTLAFRPSPEAPVQPPGRFLYEPDRAVIRAHLIDQLAEDLDAWKLDPEVAYLSSDRLNKTPFARAFSIIEVFPFSLKRLQKYLNGAQIGRLEIKKRRFPVEPETLRHRLKLRGDQPATIVLTRINEHPTVLVCQPEPVAN